MTLTSIIAIISESIFLLGIICLAFWRNKEDDSILWFGVAGVTAFLVAPDFVTNFPELGFMILLSGVVLLLKASITIAMMGGTARGFSQVKKWFGK